jgi:hypothetical protein
MGAVYLVVAITTPILAFAGALLGQLLTRRAARELEVRSRREETMRNLRWAAELAIDRDDRKAQLGVAQLRALGDSELLDAEQQGFVDAALASVLEQPLEELYGAEEAGEEVVTVLEAPVLSEELPLPTGSDVESW